jgi:hypothetical protein
LRFAQALTSVKLVLAPLVRHLHTFLDIRWLSSDAAKE